MNNINKRIMLFVFGCIFLRVLMVYHIKHTDPDILPAYAAIGLMLSIGWTFIYLTDSRKSGPEVFGDRIWWNDLRPVHASLYFLSSIYALNKSPYSYIPLGIDAGIGMSSFLIHHYLSDSFNKVYQ